MLAYVEGPKELVREHDWSSYPTPPYVGYRIELGRAKSSVMGVGSESSQNCGFWDIVTEVREGRVSGEHPCSLTKGAELQHSQFWGPRDRLRWGVADP